MRALVNVLLVLICIAAAAQRNDAKIYSDLFIRIFHCFRREKKKQNREDWEPSKREYTNN